MITIYTMAYNEEIFLQYMIDHYRNKFPDCHIILYDNESTDNTRQIALKNNCSIIDFNTNNEINEEKVRQLKNNCWKTSKTDWVLVCDVDELLNIDQKELHNEEQKNTSLILSEAYTMVNHNDDCNFSDIKYGFRDEIYDKSFLFNKKYIREINYNHGSHRCSPQGVIKHSEAKYRLYHYKYLSIPFSVNRKNYTFNRLSKINKDNGWGVHWHLSDEQIKQNFIDLREKSIKVK